MNIGSRIHIATFTVNNSTDTAITVALAYKHFVIQERTGTLGLQIRVSDNASDYWTLRAGGVISDKEMQLRGGVPTAKTYTICYVRTDGASSATVELWVSY